MLRILHVDAGREWRGGQAQVLGLLRELRDEPGIVQLLCSPHASPLSKRAADLGVEVFSVPMRNEFDFHSSRMIRRIVQEQSIDIVHTHDSHSHSAALRAVRPLREVKIVVHRRVDFRVRKGFLGKRKYGSRVNKFVAISSGVAQVLADCRIPQDQIELIPSGIDIHRFEGMERTGALRHELGIPLDAPLIGNVGAMDEHKSQRHLIEAVPEVLERIPEAHCVIVGEGPERAELEMLIETLRLGNQVHLAGWRDDIGSCLAEFDVFCLSSVKEGLCTSLLDATLFDIPLVAFRAGGVPDIVIDGETGWLAPNQDVRALGECIVEALTHSEEAMRRAAAAHRRTEDVFNVEKTAKKTLALWRHLAS